MSECSKSLRIRFRGVRGSYPVAGEQFSRYGGNTTCHEVCANGRRIIFDAGMGIVGMGKQLVADHFASGTPIIASLFFTHTHHDHVQGLPFFTPVYLNTTDLSLFGPRTPWGSLTTVLETFLSAPFHPVAMADPDMRMTRSIYDLEGGEVLLFGEKDRHPKIVAKDTQPGHNDIIIRVSANPHHPKLGVLNYRIEYMGKSYVFATDVESTDGGDFLAEFAKGADLLAHDAQYTEDEYANGKPPRKGWGHSTVQMACQTAIKADVKQLALIHHDPDHTDEKVDAMEALAKEIFPAAFAAREGMEVTL